MVSNTTPTLAFHSPFAMDVVLSALRRGDWSLLDYVTELEAHFAEREPEIEAFVPENGRFNRLRKEAEQLLARYPDPEKRPLLFGLPIGVKDIFYVNSFATQAGSRLPQELFQGKEAEVVTRLRQAGALILGKTVTTEFAYFAPGPTRNPYKPTHTPGGSSSGSAAGVGAGLCLLALGTQTIGSINRPAAYCGVVGYKPSYDRIVKTGVIPLAPAVDTIGFFTPDAAGIAVAAALLCGGWQSVTQLPGKPVLGIPTGPFLKRANTEGLAHFELICERLRTAGYQVKSVPVMPDFEQIDDAHHTIVAAEAAQVHATWFSQYPELYHDKTAALIRRGQAVDALTLETALASREVLRHKLAKVMEAAQLDLWLSPPAVGSAPFGLDSTGDPVMNLPWTHSGLPTLSLPAGFNGQGLPMGLQVTGHWYGDEKMLAAAVGLERALQRLD
ncbi:MAG: amidase [Chloroflexi bacterium]|nr:MAG: amidase [Chloroflexota bacterium]